MYQVRYTVSATKQARRQGRQSGLGREALLRIIKQVKELKYWPDNESTFEYEKVHGAFEYKFQEEQKWIRVFVYQDDFRKVMWVIKVLDKKSNALRPVDIISLKTAVSAIENDIQLFKKASDAGKKRSNLSLHEGGRS